MNTLTDSKPSAAVTVRDIPVDLWRQLKIKAATDGDTVREAVAKAIAQYVKAA
jgi:plasmid stability protein